jgi:hypothetical protein
VLSSVEKATIQLSFLKNEIEDIKRLEISSSDYMKIRFIEIAILKIEIYLLRILKNQNTEKNKTQEAL